MAGPAPVVVDGRVMLRDAQGAAFSVPEHEAAQQLQSGGFRLESPDEYHARQVEKERGTLGQQALTFGEGALKGATFGLGTAAAAELGGDEYRQAALERQQVNPNAALAGEVVGTVAPALASGGESLLAKGVGAVGAPARLAGEIGSVGERLAGRGLEALGLTGEGFLGRAAKSAIEKGVAGGIEGSAYGLGSSLADSALEGTDWTADRALANMRDGGLYGLAGGAIAGAGGEALKSAGKSIVESMFGEGKTLRQGVQEFADNRAVKSAVGNDIATFRKLTNNGEDMSRLGRVAEKMRERGIVDLGTDAEKASAINKWADEASSTLTGVAQQLDAANIRPDLAPIQDAIKEQTARLRETGSTEHARVAKQVERQADKILNPQKIRIAHPDGTVENTFRTPTFTELRKFKSALGEVTKWARDTKSIATAEYEKLYGTVARALDDAADTAGPDVGNAWKAANQDASDALTIKKGVERETQRKLKNRFISPSDYATGGLTGSLIGSLSMMATGSLPLSAVTAALSGAVTSAAHKFVRERGSAMVANLADHAADVVLRTKEAARGLVGVSKAPARAAAAYGVDDAKKQYEQVSNFVQSAQQDPSVLAEHIQRVTAPYATFSPEVAYAMGKRISEDHAWLRQKLPVPMTRMGTSLTPLHEKSVVPKRDQVKLVRYAQALADPVGVLEDAAHGHVNWDGIDAVKERRPELWQDFRLEIAKACSESETELPRRRRILLSLAFDFDGDKSFGLMKDVAAQGGGDQQPPKGLPAQSSVGAMKSAETAHGTAYQQALEGAAA